MKQFRHFMIIAVITMLPGCVVYAHPGALIYHDTPVYVHRPHIFQPPVVYRHRNWHHRGYAYPRYYRH